MRTAERRTGRLEQGIAQVLTGKRGAGHAARTGYRIRVITTAQRKGWMRAFDASNRNRAIRIGRRGTGRVVVGTEVNRGRAADGAACCNRCGDIDGLRDGGSSLSSAMR